MAATYLYLLFSLSYADGCLLPCHATPPLFTRAAPLFHCLLLIFSPYLRHNISLPRTRAITLYYAYTTFGEKSALPLDIIGLHMVIDTHWLPCYCFSICFATRLHYYQLVIAWQPLCHYKVGLLPARFQLTWLIMYHMFVMPMLAKKAAAITLRHVRRRRARCRCYHFMLYSHEVNLLYATLVGIVVYIIMPSSSLSYAPPLLLPLAFTPLLTAAIFTIA